MKKDPNYLYSSVSLNKKTDVMTFKVEFDLFLKKRCFSDELN